MIYQLMRFHAERLPASASAQKLRAEIMIDGFVPSKYPRAEFDIAITHPRVVAYMEKTGFRVVDCASYHEGRLSGGDFDRPYTDCRHDVFADLGDSIQYRVSLAVTLLSETNTFGGKLFVNIAGSAVRINPSDQDDCVKFMEALHTADEIKVSFSYPGQNGENAYPPFSIF